MKSKFTRIFDIFDSIELVVVIVFATILFVAVLCAVFLGVLQSGNYLALCSFVVLVISTVVAIVRDLLKKHLGVVSICVCIIWFACVIYVLWFLEEA